VDAVQDEAVIRTSRKKIPLFAVFARAFDKIPNIKIECISVHCHHFILQNCTAAILGAALKEVSSPFFNTPSGYHIASWITIQNLNRRIRLLVWKAAQPENRAGWVAEPGAADEKSQRRDRHG